MAAIKPVDEDGALRPALQALEDAVHALCGPQSQYLEGRVVYIPSRYLQLMDAVTGEQSNSGGGGGSKSRPPFWTDAFDCLNEIDTAVECWMPAFEGVPPTVGRLKGLQAKGWRPQDTRQLEQITEAVGAWVSSIEQLLNPVAQWTLPYACPNCEAKTVYRRDSGGEMVRQPALKIGTDGCTCGRCKAHWPPGRFLFLGKLLDTLPDNVDTP